MKNEITDEQIDQLLKAVMQESAATEETIADVAASPRVWWAVQREIAVQKEQRSMPWPPVSNWLRVLGFGVPVAAAVLIALFVFNFRPVGTTERSGLQQNDGQKVNDNVSSLPSEPVALPDLSPKNITPVKATSASVKQPRQTVARLTYRNDKVGATPDVMSNAKTNVKSNEIKSDFIALSYAGKADSGQIVRVKVPSSMKVQLGIAQNVSDPTDMVDAEVLIGDDGITRAIRFIRQSGEPK